MDYPPWVNTDEARERWDSLSHAERDIRLRQSRLFAAKSKLKEDKHKNQLLQYSKNHSACFSDPTYHAARLERQRLAKRKRYREAHGIPLDAPLLKRNRAPIGSP